MKTMCDPESPAEQAYIRGIEHEKAGRLPEAARCFEESLVHSFDPLRCLRLARVLGARRVEGDEFRERAIEACRSIIEYGHSSVYAQACFLLGSLLDDSEENYEDAVRAYLDGLAVDDSSVVAHNNTGAILCELGRFREAEEHFAKVIALRPGYELVYRNLAKMYFRWIGEDSMHDAVARLCSEHPDGAPKILCRLMMALVEFSRRDAFEEFYRHGHRLKNQLTVVASRIKRLRRRLRSERDGCTRVDDELGEVAVSVGEGISELRDYLDLIRPNGPVCLQRVDANSLVRTVVEKLGRCRGSTLSVEMSLGRDLPTAVADPLSLGEALMNLATNALDAVGDEGKVLFATSYDENCAKLVLAVEDSGEGIPEQRRRDVFRPGYTTKKGGNGLGLALVQRTMGDLGGRVIMERSSLGGMRFVLLVPTAEGIGGIVGRGLGDRPVDIEDTSSLLAEELT